MKSEFDWLQTHFAWLHHILKSKVHFLFILLSRNKSISIYLIPNKQIISKSMPLVYGELNFPKSKEFEMAGLKW